jgi:hypothetical protein
VIGVQYFGTFFNRIFIFKGQASMVTDDERDLMRWDDDGGQPFDGSASRCDSTHSVSSITTDCDGASLEDGQEASFALSSPAFPSITTDLSK